LERSLLNEKPKHKTKLGAQHKARTTMTTNDKKAQLRAQMLKPAPKDRRDTLHQELARRIAIKHRQEDQEHVGNVERLVRLCAADTVSEKREHAKPSQKDVGTGDATKMGAPSDKTRAKSADAKKKLSAPQFSAGRPRPRFIVGLVLATCLVLQPHLLTMLVVWTVVFFLALAIGMGAEGARDVGIGVGHWLHQYWRREIAWIGERFGPYFQPAPKELRS
jgi:hypothetical protein